MSDAVDQLENNWEDFMDSILKKYPPLPQGSVWRELERQVAEDSPVNQGAKS